MFVAALAFFAAGAAARGLWHSDEHRIAEVVREMSVPGGDRIVPHLAGAVYEHKPPLVMWIATFAHAGLGLDLPFAVRVPSILGAALAVLGTFLIGRRLHGTAAGAAAAVVLATAAEFDWICRRAQYDPLLAGFTTLALWCFVRSWFPKVDEPRTPWRDAVFGSLFTGLAILVKGPVALVFTAPVILAFLLATRVAHRLWSPRILALLLVVAVPFAWLAAAAAREGWQFAWDLAIGRAAAQLGADESKVEPFWYYVVAFLRGFAPWTLFIPAAVLALVKWRRDGEHRASLFAAAWVIVPLVLMSCVARKRDLYLLPLYPGAALCVGKIASVDEDLLRSATFQVPRRALAALVLVGGLATVLLLGMELADFTGLVQPKWIWVRNAFAAAGTTGLLVLVATGALLVVLGWQALRTPSPHRAFDRLLGAAFVATIAFATVALPAIDDSVSPRAFYEKAAKLADGAPVARYGVDDFAGHWAMGRADLPFVGTADAAARFLESAAGPAYVVAEGEFLEKRGYPRGTSIVHVQRLPLSKDLYLLGRNP